jgi:hypothetical protein
MYEGYHFWGMHLIWWFIWILQLTLHKAIFQKFMQNFSHFIVRMVYTRSEKEVKKEFSL